MRGLGRRGRREGEGGPPHPGARCREPATAVVAAMQQRKRVIMLALKILALTDHLRIDALGILALAMIALIVCVENQRFGTISS